MRAHPAARTDHRRAWLSAALLLAAALPTAARGQEPTPLPPSVVDAGHGGIVCEPVTSARSPARFRAWPNVSSENGATCPGR